MSNGEFCIDVVQEWADARFLQPPGFVNRGDPAPLDFSWLNNAFFPLSVDLDLSGIIPANTSAVVLRLFVIKNAVSHFARFRTKGNASWTNGAIIRIQVANVENDLDIVVVPDANGIVEMGVSAGIWAEISICVAGWWL